MDFLSGMRKAYSIGLQDHVNVSGEGLVVGGGVSFNENPNIGGKCRVENAMRGYQ